MVCHVTWLVQGVCNSVKREGGRLIFLKVAPIRLMSERKVKAHYLSFSTMFLAQNECQSTSASVKLHGSLYCDTVIMKIEFTLIL